jgi:hypothetical protein
MQPRPSRPHPSLAPAEPSRGAALTFRFSFARVAWIRHLEQLNVGGSIGMGGVAHPQLKRVGERLAVHCEAVIEQVARAHAQRKRGGASRTERRFGDGEEGDAWVGRGGAARVQQAAKDEERAARVERVDVGTRDGEARAEGDTRCGGARRGGGGTQKGQRERGRGGCEGGEAPRDAEVEEAVSKSEERWCGGMVEVTVSCATGCANTNVGQSGRCRVGAVCHAPRVCSARGGAGWAAFERRVCADCGRGRCSYCSRRWAAGRRRCSAR